MPTREYIQILKAPIRGHIFAYLLIYSHCLSINIRLLMLLIKGQGILDSVYIHKDYTGLK